MISALVVLVLEIHSAEKNIRPPFFYHSTLFDIPTFFRNMQPPSFTPLPPLDMAHQKKNRFYDNTQSGRLKTININHGNLIPRETVCLKY